MGRKDGRGLLMNHFGTKRLETTRLILRQFELGDAEAMYRNWASDSEVTKFLTWPTYSGSDDSRDVLEDWIANYSSDTFYHWAIVWKEIGQPIGSISVVRQSDDVGMVCFGYCIGKKWWGGGITAEAFAALITFFFEEVGASRIEAQHDPHNPNSGKVMLKCGLQFEGTMRKSGKNNQGICDLLGYAILSEDYFGRVK